MWSPKTWFLLLAKLLIIIITMDSFLTWIYKMEIFSLIVFLWEANEIMDWKLFEFCPMACGVRRYNSRKHYALRDNKGKGQVKWVKKKKDELFCRAWCQETHNLGPEIEESLHCSSVVLEVEVYQVLLNDKDLLEKNLHVWPWNWILKSSQSLSRWLE